MSDTLTIPVALPAGEVAVDAIWDRASSESATPAVLVLAHGAGAGMRHPFLAGFAAAMAAAGVSTLRFDFPYMQAGRRMPGPAAHAVAAWTAAVDAARADAAGTDAAGTAVFAGGKSYGGRMASMAAAEGAIAVSGLVYLGYPLHPPGRPDALRVAHLPAITAPQLFVSGTNDPFVDPHAQLESAVAACPHAQIAWVDGGHSFEVRGRRRPADEVGADLAPLVAGWLRDH